MKKATPQQLSKLHVLLQQLGLLEEKANLVFQFSNYQATSSKELTVEQARELIQQLERMADPDEACARMRRKVFALAYESGIIYGDTAEDKKMNAAKINAFLRDRGTVRKNLNSQSREELIATVSQFQQLAKHKNESEASKSARKVLSELGIQTEKKRRPKRN